MRGKAPYAVVVLAFTVAVVTMLAGVAIGQTVSGHGGTPSDVYTQTNGEACTRAWGGAINETLAMQQTSPSDPTPNVLVFFTTRWERLNTSEEGLTFVGLTGSPDSAEWNMAGNARTRMTQTAMWSFNDVQPGAHSVSVFGRVDPTPAGPGGDSNASADMTVCSLTVFVMPVAGRSNREDARRCRRRATELVSRFRGRPAPVPPSLSLSLSLSLRGRRLRGDSAASWMNASRIRVRERPKL